MSIADKLTIIAENEQRVYNAGVEFGKTQGGGGATEEELEAAREEGRQAEKDAFWDMFQNNGKRNIYSSAFQQWSAEYIRPKYKVVPTDTNSAGSTFNGCSKLKKIESQYFDFSQKAEGTSNNAGYYYTFSGCNKLEEIEDIGLLPQHNYYNTFAYCYQLKTITKMGVNENTKFNASTFITCRELENLTIDGTIGQNNFNLKDSTKLSKASIESVINALSDNGEHLNTVSNPTVTLSKTAVENAFPKIDLLAEATFSGSVTQNGLTITNNGDGSFTLNGTYDGYNAEVGHSFPLHFNAAVCNITPKEGIYTLSVDGDVHDIYAENSAGDAIYKEYGELITAVGEYTVTLVIESGKTYNNVTIRPTLVYDEWESLIYHISHFWTIALV